MDVTYGKGTYIKEKTLLNGQIILGAHKLFLRTSQGDLPSSYVPLEKIIELRRNGDAINFLIKQTMAYSYQVTIQGARASIKDLTQEIILRRGLKKQFLRNVWVEDPA